jgi:predicted PurR-regulated permease PerM
MKFLEGHLFKFLEPRMKSKRKAKKTSRGIAITGSLVFLVGICVLLVAAIVPSISESIQSMITSFPQEAKDLTKWVDEVIQNLHP